MSQEPMAVTDTAVVIRELVDYLLPELTPYEATMYLFILRHTFLNDGAQSIRIGKRTIAARFAKGSRGERSNFEHITNLLKRPEEKGCLKIGDITREGSLYTLVPPREIPVVIEKLVASTPAAENNDYFSDEAKRREVFERDNWTCQYCGETVTSENSTLDHYIPKSKGGSNSKENLRTACLVCNSVKSGRSYEEAAPYLLRSIRERKARTDDT
jgi:hypothetical protein